MARETILVVDDNALNVKLVDRLLRHEGYTVHTAEDAEQALAVLEHVVPDLVLMDLQLPGMDGLELTRRLRARERTKDLPILAVTAYAMKGDDQKALDAGCVAYVTKPIDTRTLPAVLRDVLDRRTS